MTKKIVIAIYISGMLYLWLF